MKHLRIFLLWALLLGSAPLALGQRSSSKPDTKKDQDKREEIRERDDSEDEEDEGEELFSTRPQHNSQDDRTPDPRNRSKNMASADVGESEAFSASEEIAESFGITDPQDQKELLKACRKYFRAKELLDSEFADKKNGQYLKKHEILEREYSRELSRILPQG